MSVAESKVMILNGSGYDDFATKLVEAGATKPIVINVSQLSGLQTGEDFNEHVWYSLPTMAKLADQLRKTGAGAGHEESREGRRP